MDTTAEIAGLNLDSKNLSDLARVIGSDWKKVNFAAVPYLNAMFSLSTLNDKYGCDDGRSIVAYFLANAQTWKGPIAKAIKSELNKRLKKH